jgi:hypothetical protein
MDTKLTLKLNGDIIEQAKNYAKEQVEKGFGAQEIPGTRNFVVFPGEEKSMTILERNGQKFDNSALMK